MEEWKCSNKKTMMNQQGEITIKLCKSLVISPSKENFMGQSAEAEFLG
jgi:hypothetical protein